MMRDALYGAPWLSAMARVFDRAGERLYIVGGAVRNPLLGLPISDVDVCGPARPERVCALCEGTEVRARMRAAQFGTVELYARDGHGQEHMAEYTAWREDSYLTGHRPDGVTFTDDIRVDAHRRDFSVNALYRRVHDGWLEDVIDPTGGLRHLRLGVLHTVTRDPDAVLSNDGVRILRAARFQAEMDLRPTQAVQDSLARNVQLLADIAAERLREETEKILMADLRYPALCRRDPATFSGLWTLARCGAWPMVFGGAAFDEASARALAHFPGTLAERMALLFHKESPEAVEQLMLRLRFPVREAKAAAVCVSALRALGGPLFDLVRSGRDALHAARRMLCALGDANRLRMMDDTLAVLQDRPFSLRELAVSGEDLKPVFIRQALPLRGMGAALESLWRAVVEGRCPNERGALMRLAEAQKDQSS